MQVVIPNGIVINPFSLIICSFFSCHGEMWNSDGSERVQSFCTRMRAHFFSVRSRASMVDGDAIVEKLNRSDGNSRPNTWPLATYVYAYVHLTHSRICIYFFPLHTHWKMRYAVRSDEYGVHSSEDFYLLVSSYRNASYFCTLWFLPKYLHIIYDGNLDEAICLPRLKEKYRNLLSR